MNEFLSVDRGSHEALALGLMALIAGEDTAESEAAAWYFCESLIMWRKSNESK